MPDVVASRMRVLLNSIVDLERFAINAGTMIIAPKKIGPNTVAKMNHRVRTRSRYSRFMIAQSLAMSADPRFDTGCAYTFQKYLVQRGPHDLEAIDRCTCADNALKQCLRVCAVGQLDLEVAIGVVNAPDQ